MRYVMSVSQGFDEIKETLHGSQEELDERLRELYASGWVYKSPAAAYTPILLCEDLPRWAEGWQYND